MKIYKIFQNILQKNRNSEEHCIDYENAKDILKNDKQSSLIDVRSKQEYEEYHLLGSINIPLLEIEKNCEKIKLKKEDTIIVYCQSGYRSKKAAEILQKQGYKNVYEIKGGLNEI